MKVKEDFERIARQAREFREQEEKRIAAEKEEEARLFAAEKKAERDRIAHAHEEALKNQQQWDAGHNNNNNNNNNNEGSSLLPVSPSESKASQQFSPGTGTVKLRAQWLGNLAKDAASRRRLEEEFVSMLAARRKQHPDEAATDAEAAVKAALESSSSSSLSFADSNQQLLSEEDDFEEAIQKLRDQTAHIAEEVESAEQRLLKGSVDLNEEFDEIDKELEAEEEKHRRVSSDDNPHQSNIEQTQVDNASPRLLMDEFDDSEKAHATKDKSPVSSDSPSAESSTTTTIQENTVAEPVRIQSESVSKKEESIYVQPQQQMVLDDFEYGAEVDPRTQAMLDDDDFVPSGNKNTRNDGGDANVKGRDKKSLVVEGSIPVDRKILKRIKDSSQNNSDDEDDFGTELVHKEATFELPMEVSENGLKLSPHTADLTMITTIPPSRLDGRLSGILEGRSSLGEQTSTVSGSASLEYKSSRHSRVTLGMIRGCEPHHPLITIGGRLIRHGTNIGVTFYHNAEFLHRMMLEHSLWSLSFRHCFPNSKWTLSSQLSRRKDLSLSLANGNKLSGLIGWNLLKPKQFHARIDARPKLTEYRRAHVYCQWMPSSSLSPSSSGLAAWNFGISLVQSLHSQIATVGLGWRLFSTRGFEWVISWTRGNATIRIPILVSKSLATSATLGQTVYFSIISYMIQEYIAEAWGWIGSSDDEENTAEDVSIAQNGLHLAKARRDASVQKELMARQARRRADLEKEKDGLVIQEGIYRIENGEEWDVTIPLQFWVSNSTLRLPARPKSELLGFYDIAASLKHSSAVSFEQRDPSEGGKSHPSGRHFHFPPLGDIWRDLLDWAPRDSMRKKSDLCAPTLAVRYEFQGKSYEITVKDREELRLPHI
eukprot:jgi/Psemu1/70202/estExt_Genemark1.C_15410003